MNGEFGIEYRGNGVTLDNADMTGRPPEIDSVNDENSVSVLKNRQEIEAHGPAVNDLHFGKKGISFPDGVYCMYTYSFVGQQDIAEA